MLFALQLLLCVLAKVYEISFGPQFPIDIQEPNSPITYQLFCFVFVASSSWDSDQWLGHFVSQLLPKFFVEVNQNSFSDLPLKIRITKIKLI